MSELGNRSIRGAVASGAIPGLPLKTGPVIPTQHPVVESGFLWRVTEIATKKRASPCMEMLSIRHVLVVLCFFVFFLMVALCWLDLVRRS